MIKRILLEFNIDHESSGEGEALMEQIRGLVSEAFGGHSHGSVKLRTFDDEQIHHDITQAGNVDEIDTFTDAGSAVQIGSCSFNITAQGSSSNDFVNACIEVICGSLEDESFNIQVMANRLNFSKPTFYRRVKQATGLSAKTFVRQVKMQIACKLLQTKNFTVIEVAWRCGYSSSRHFSKIFYAMFRQYPSSFLS